MQGYEQLKQEIETLTQEACLVGAADAAVVVSENSQEDLSMLKLELELMDNSVQVERYPNAREWALADLSKRW
jgi:hypothetical protein